MTDVLEQLERRAHRTGRGDPRAIFRAAVSEADEVRALHVADEAVVSPRRRPQRVALVALVASIALFALGIVWLDDRGPMPPAGDTFPASDVRFGANDPPDGYELSGVRRAMYGPVPQVRVMTTVYAPDAAAATSITVLVRRGEPFIPDMMVPTGAPIEIIDGHEVKIADDTIRSGSVIAGWDRLDGSRVFVVGRGVGIDEVREAVRGLALDAADLATLTAPPAGFERRFAGDGTGSLLAVSAHETYLLQYSPIDGSRRQVSVRTMPGAGFEPLALRWFDPGVQAVVLPDGSPAYLASKGRSWIKVMPEGVATIGTYEVEAAVDIPGFVARVQPLTSEQWEAAVGDTEVVVGLITSGPEMEVVATPETWRTEPGP